MLAKAAGALVRPQVERFVFQHALRMSSKDLLAGATTAADVVSAALRDACATKEPAKLDGLLEKKLLEPKLHKACARRGNFGQRALEE